MAAIAAGSEAELRSFLMKLTRDAGLAGPVTASELCEGVASLLHRPIRVAGRPIPTASGAGSAMPIGEGYLILYQAATSLFHQEHIILHELVHIVRGHLEKFVEEPLECRVGHEDSTIPTTGAAGSGRLATMEWEAETGALILGEWSQGGARLRNEAGDSSQAQRYGRALEGGHGWI